MTFGSFRRAASLSPILFAVLLGACQSATDYSSEYADEEEIQETPNLVSGIMQSMGVVADTRGNGIDYTPRAPLVVPPSTTTLATPQSPLAVEANPDWPVDPDLEASRQRRIAALREQGIDPDVSPVANPSELLATRVAPATDEELAAIARDRRYNEDPSRTLMPSQLATPTGYTAGGSGALYDASGNPIRPSLTAPPVEYLRPAEGGPPLVVEEEDDSWFW
jgi:hypothetical protein